MRRERNPVKVVPTWRAAAVRSRRSVRDTSRLNETPNRDSCSIARCDNQQTARPPCRAGIRLSDGVRGGSTAGGEGAPYPRIPGPAPRRRSAPLDESRSRGTSHPARVGSTPCRHSPSRSIAALSSCWRVPGCPCPLIGPRSSVSSCWRRAMPCARTSRSSRRRSISCCSSGDARSSSRWRGPGRDVVLGVKPAGLGEIEFEDAGDVGPCRAARELRGSRREQAVGARLRSVGECSVQSARHCARGHAGRQSGYGVGLAIVVRSLHCVGARA